MVNNFDIAIIGSSYAGMSCALALANISPDLKIAIIEKEDIFLHEKKADGRAYAISAQSLKFFKKIKIYDELEKVGGKICDIKITDDKSPFVLDFIGSEVVSQNSEFNGQLGQVIENHFIFEVLKKRLKEQKNITIFCPNFYEEITFDDDSKSSKLNFVQIKLNNAEIIKSRLLLACDGRFSELRKHFNISFLQKNYHQTAIVFKISHQFDHQNIAHEKFLRSGPFAILPLKEMKQSSIVWIVKNEEAQAILSLDNENFLQQMHKKMQNCLGQCQIISEKFSYPLSLVESDKLYHSQALLIGDSGCAVHPIAGQGFNLAISGIEILCELLSKNMLCGLDFASSQVIEEYNKKVKFNAKKMLIATDVLNSIFENDSLAVAVIRDLGLGLINSSKKIKNFFIKNAGGF
jgi:2-octaprenyl-6-methoxyphenol hydroxylase